jgi:glycosyltransferase involved in cell wall biosynthesis
VKLLVISFNFPPYNASGCVRVGKLVQFLVERGHDVRVVAGHGLDLPQTLDIPFGDAKVVRVPYWRIEAPIDWARRSMVARRGPNAGGAAQNPTGGIAHRLVTLYRAALAIPDGQAGWIIPAMRAARLQTRDWRPDVIVSSALPFSSHVVAARLARRLGVAWVAEFRDLFAENPYNFAGRWRRALDRIVERFVMRGVSGCVTVSPPLAKTLEAMHSCPTEVVLNGFDPNDVQPGAQPPTGFRPLKILYTGIIYPGRRDPRPLFAAIASLGARKQRINVEFVGQDLRGVRAMAVAAGISEQVSIKKPVTYREALRLQQEADVLLLLLWDHPSEEGVYTGKLFEYAGASRPILSIGAKDGLAARLIEERGLGKAATRVEEIAAILSAWIDTYDSCGFIVGPSLEARSGLSRNDQFEKFETFIRQFSRSP